MIDGWLINGFLLSEVAWCESLAPSWSLNRLHGSQRLAKSLSKEYTPHHIRDPTLI